MALISAGPQVMHGRAVVAGTRVPVRVILDCLAAGMAAEEIVAEYPAVKCCGRARGGRLRRGAGTRGVAAATAVAVKFKLDENPPASSAAILADAGHDVDTVGQEGLSGAADPDEVAAAAATGRVLISLDVGSEQYQSCSAGYCESAILDRTLSLQGEDLNSASC